MSERLTCLTQEHLSLVRVGVECHTRPWAVCSISVLQNLADGLLRVFVGDGDVEDELQLARGLGKVRPRQPREIQGPLKFRQILLWNLWLAVFGLFRRRLKQEREHGTRRCLDTKLVMTSSRTMGLAANVVRLLIQRRAVHIEVVDGDDLDALLKIFAWVQRQTEFFEWSFKTKPSPFLPIVLYLMVKEVRKEIISICVDAPVPCGRITF